MIINKHYCVFIPQTDIKGTRLNGKIQLFIRKVPDFMNLYHLRYFVTLAHLEHYTKAAEILSITQPSLSHAISSLESELGVKLFEKDGRNVVLTKCGQAFLVDVEQALDMLDSSINKLQMTGFG